jgi:hypothetical protein
VVGDVELNKRRHSNWSSCNERIRLDELAFIPVTVRVLLHVHAQTLSMQN